MIQPTIRQLGTIKEILETSIDELILNDSNIFNIDIVMPKQISAEQDN